MVGGYALELIPTWSGLVLSNGRLRYFKREIVFGNTIEGTDLYIRRHCTLTNDAPYAVTIRKRTTIVTPCSFITNVLKTFWEN